MNITGIRPYEAVGFVGMNNLSKSEQAINSYVGENEKKEDYNEARARQVETSYDYAKRYNPEETFSLKGADSDLATLDAPNKTFVKPKDDVLSQFQTFVGNVETKDDNGRKLYDKTLENFDIV